MVDAIKLPDPPASLIELRELEKLFSEVDDWVAYAYGQNTENRIKGFAKAMTIVAYRDRALQFLRIDNDYHARNVEIEKAREVFKTAYEEQKKKLDHTAIAEYACTIYPILEKQKVDALKELGPAWKRELARRDAKKAAVIEKRNNKVRRSRGKSSERNECISKTDRS